MYRDGDVHRWVADEDINVGSLGAPSQAGRRFEDPESLSIEAAFQDTPDAAYDPHARVKAMAVDGVIGEVIYPTIAVRLVETDIDSALMSACFRAMNDWMADFSTAYPHSIKGSGVVNVDDIDDALSEMERCVKLGLASITIPAYPGEGRTYDLPRYDRFWALAQDLGMPLAMHSGSYRPGPGVIGSFANDITVGGTSSFRASEDYWPRRAIGDMMFSGVFERFPKLTVGAVEFELGWAAYFIQQMDRHYADHHYVKEIQFNGRLPAGRPVSPERLRDFPGGCCWNRHPACRRSRQYPLELRLSPHGVDVAQLPSRPEQIAGRCAANRGGEDGIW